MLQPHQFLLETLLSCQMNIGSFSRIYRRFHWSKFIHTRLCLQISKFYSRYRRLEKTRACDALWDQQLLYLYLYRLWLLCFSLYLDPIWILQQFFSFQRPFKLIADPCLFSKNVHLSDIHILLFLLQLNMSLRLFLSSKLQIIRTACRILEKVDPIAKL